MKSLVLSVVVSLMFSAVGFAADPPNAEMQAWMKYATPGEGHKALTDLAGKWKFTMKWWAAEGAKAEESTGTSTSKWILGNRFLQQDVKGKANGQPFLGMGLVGYDNLREEYQSIWLDNMGTGMMMGKGTMDTASRTLTETGDFSCPMTGNKNRWYRTEMKVTDKNNHTFAMFTKDAEGKEFKSMEIAYKRSK